MYGTPERSSYPKFYKTSILIYESVCTYQSQQVELKDLSLEIKQLHQRVVSGTYNLPSDIPQIVKLSPETSKEWRVTSSDQCPTGVAAEWGNISGTSRTEAELHKSLPTLPQGLEISDSPVEVLEETADTRSSRNTPSNLSKSVDQTIDNCLVHTLTDKIDNTRSPCHISTTKSVSCQSFKMLRDVCKETRDIKCRSSHNLNIVPEVLYEA